MSREKIRSITTYPLKMINDTKVLGVTTAEGDEAIRFVLKDLDFKNNSTETGEDYIEFELKEMIVNEGDRVASLVEYEKRGDRFLIIGRGNKTALRTGLKGRLKFEMTNKGPDLWYGTPGKDLKVLKHGETVYVDQDTYGDFRIGSEERRVEIDISEPVVAVEFPEEGGIGTSTVDNIGSAEAYPRIMLEKGAKSETIVQVKDKRIGYIFPKGENEVIIDAYTNKAYYKGQNRDAFVTIHEGLKLLPGKNLLRVKGDAKVYLIRKDRWI